jgi:hypothetical protein
METIFAIVCSATPEVNRCEFYSTKEKAIVELPVDKQH